MIIQCSLHHTIMCASFSFNALGIRPHVAIIFSEPRSALDASRSILNELRACYRCHKVARQSVGVCAPCKGAKAMISAGDGVRVGMRRSTDLEPHPVQISAVRGCDIEGQTAVVCATNLTFPCCYAA